MRILLDTQILIWALEEDHKLSDKARTTILTADEVFVSSVSFYEIAVKLKIGKKIGANKSLSITLEAAQLSDYQWLLLQKNHLVAYQQIPLFEQHRDPFD